MHRPPWLYVHPRAYIACYGVGGIAVLAALQGASRLAYALLYADDLSPLATHSAKLSLGFAVCNAILVGAILIGAGARLRNWLEAPALLAAQHPNEPWLWRSDWASKRIRLSSAKPIVGAIIVAALIAFALQRFVAMSAAGQVSPNARYWFPAVLVVVSYATFRGFLLNRRWRQSELSLGTLPGVIGGSLEAVVVLPEVSPIGSAFRLTLSCERSHHTLSNEDANQGGFFGTFNPTTKSPESVWQSDVVVDRPIDVGRRGLIGLPVYFAIPYHCDPTARAVSPSKLVEMTTTWRLTVSAKDTGDFRSVCFEVPVFRTKESDPSFSEDSDALRDYVYVADDELTIRSLGVRDETLPNGSRRLTFSVFRFDFFAVALSIVCLSLIAIALIAAYVRPWVLILIAAPIPTLLFCVCGKFMVEMLFWKTQLEIQPETVDIETGYFGRRRRFTVRRAECSRLRQDVEFKNPRGERRRIFLQTVSQGQVDLLRRVDGREDAEAAIKWLTECFR